MHPRFLSVRQKTAVSNSVRQIFTLKSSLKLGNSLGTVPKMQNRDELSSLG